MRAGALVLLTFTCLASAGKVNAATLEGWASLPANTLMPGPGSGHFINADKSITLPFDGQPVQGFSAILSNGDGTFLALADNGFGTRANSADSLLRIYSIEPDFRTVKGGNGTMEIEGFVTLSNPQGHKLMIQAYRHDSPVDSESAYSPHESIAENRLLTGADFDPESFQRAPDDTLWIGEELGPFLLHMNAEGELLESPFELQGLVAEGRIQLQEVNPTTQGIPVVVARPGTIRRSRGFEGMAISPSGNKLYPMLEGALNDQPGSLNIYTFDLDSQSFENRSAQDPSYRYQLEPGGTAAGAFKLFSETGGLVLERDSGEALKALHKKVYRIDFNSIDDNGFLVKKEIADLMNIADPHDLNADGRKIFNFPFHTPEGLLILDKNTIGLINDNNFPFGRGRGAEAGPENTEFILISVEDLW